MKIQYDKNNNRYIQIPSDFVSGARDVKVLIPETKAVFAYVLEIDGKPICFDYNGWRELIQAMVQAI